MNIFTYLNPLSWIFRIESKEHLLEVSEVFVKIETSGTNVSNGNDCEGPARVSEINSAWSWPQL